jgi:hypothetical protein
MAKHNKTDMQKGQVLAVVLLILGVVSTVAFQWLQEAASKSINPG